MTVIRSATEEDIKEIMEIKRSVLELFCTLSDPQWNENYPLREDFLSDLKKGNLFVAEEDETVAGFGVIESVLPPEYDALPFCGDKSSACHFCRFALKKEFRGTDLSALLLDYLSKKALRRGAKYLFADTHETNLPMQKFLIKQGFEKVALFRFIPVEGNFVAFEKNLDNTHIAK